MKVNYALNHHWYETNLLFQAVLNYVMSTDLIVKEVCAIEGPVLYPYKNEEICVALFHIRIFCVYITIFTTLHYLSIWLTCKCMDHMYVTVALDCSGSTRVTHFQLWI